MFCIRISEKDNGSVLLKIVRGMTVAVVTNLHAQPEITQSLTFLGNRAILQIFVPRNLCPTVGITWTYLLVNRLYRGGFTVITRARRENENL